MIKNFNNKTSVETVMILIVLLIANRFCTHSAAKRRTKKQKMNMMIIILKYPIPHFLLQWDEVEDTATISSNREQSNLVICNLIERRTISLEKL